MPPILLRLAALQALLCAGLLATASARAACPASDWTGTIGNAPVTLHFGEQDYEAGKVLVARYYYRLSLEELYLRADPTSPGRWSESDFAGRATGHLEMDCQGSALTGTWRSVDGRRVLPLRARPASADQPYDARRVRALEPDRIETKAFEARYFDTVAHSGIPDATGLSLWGETPAIARINARLGVERRAGMAQALACSADLRMNQGPSRESEHFWSQDIKAWNDRYVVIVTQDGGYCAGSAVYAMSPATFQLADGEPVDTALWLKAEYRGQISLTSPIGRLLTSRLLSQAEIDPDCLSTIAIFGGQAYPERSGMVFDVRPSSQLHLNCQGTVTLPWDQIGPALSPAGRDGAAAFR